MRQNSLWVKRRSSILVDNRRLDFTLQRERERERSDLIRRNFVMLTVKKRKKQEEAEKKRKKKV